MLMEGRLPILEEYHYYITLQNIIITAKFTWKDNKQK